MRIAHKRIVGLIEYLVLGLILVVSSTSGCKRSEIDSLNSGWNRLSDPPLAGAISLRQAAASPCAWSVQVDGRRLVIQRLPDDYQQQPHEVRAQFAGITLIGENRGEWGGSLSVLDATDKAPRTILSKNVLQIVPMFGGVAVITGNLQANEGAIWFYSNPTGHGWAIQKRADLHGYPRVTGRSGDHLLFVYGDAVSSMEKFKEQLIADLPLLEVSPNSIAQDSQGNIYVGMNAFVVRLVPHRNGYSQQWFTQHNCLP